MRKKPVFTFLMNISLYELLCLYFAVLLSGTFAVLLLLNLYYDSPAYAEEPRIFTDDDLVNYDVGPMVDQETLYRLEADLNSYEKNKASELLLQKEQMKKKRAEEERKLAFQRKQKVKVSNVPGSSQSIKNSGSGYITPQTSFSVQKIVNNSGTGFASPPVSTRRT